MDDNHLQLLYSNIDDLKAIRDKVKIFYRKQSTASSSTINSTVETTGDELVNCNPDNQDIDSLIIQMKETIINGRIYFQKLYNQPRQSKPIKTLLQSHEKVLNDLEKFVNSIESTQLISSNNQPSTSSTDQPIRPLSPQIVINYHNDGQSLSSTAISSTAHSFDQSSKSPSSQSLQSINNQPTTIKTKQFDCPSSPSTSIGSSIHYDHKYNYHRQLTTNFHQNNIITYQQLTQLFNNLMSNKFIQLLTLTSLILLLILINTLP